MSGQKKKQEDGKAAGGATASRAALPVKVVIQLGDNAVVERAAENGSLSRRIVPARLVTGGEIAAEAWEAGAVYGIEWESYITPLSVTPEEIADGLRRAGIWTKDDLLKNPRAALGALQAAFGFCLAALIEAVRDK